MSKDWKNHFLSSGLPLEHEASLMLKDKGFVVEGEFPYTRKEGESIKEFSVDLAAHHYLPPKDDSGGIQGMLKILCECKYRSPDKIWLFTPDLNEPDFSSLGPHGIRSFGGLSAHSFDENPLKKFGNKPAGVIKGLEVFKHGNRPAYDKDIRHAISQLRYALPSIASDALFTMLETHPDDSKPVFVVPILLTNADLFLLKDDTSLSKIHEAGSLGELIEPVPFVEIYSPCNDDFHQHAKWGFRELGDPAKIFADNLTLRLLEDYYTKQGKSKYFTPLAKLYSLSRGGSNTPGFYSQFLVVSLSSFPKIIDDILEAVTQSVSKGTKLV